MTRLWEIFSFEFGYQVRRFSTRLYLVMFLALAAGIMQIFIGDARNDGYFFNAPVIVAAVIITSSIVALLVAAGIAGDSATRDAQVRIHSLLYTTPLRKATYISGRFLAVFAVMCLLLLAVALGQIAISHFCRHRTGAPRPVSRRVVSHRLLLLRRAERLRLVGGSLC